MRRTDPFERTAAVARRPAALPAHLAVLVILATLAAAGGTRAEDPDPVAPATQEQEEESGAEDIEGDPIEPSRHVPAPFRDTVIQQAAQYEGMTTQELHSQLRLIRTLHADLTPDARREIAAAGRRAVKVAAMRISEFHHVPREQLRARGRSVAGAAADGVAGAVRNFLGLAAGAPAPEPVAPDPGAIVAAGLAAALGKRIDAEASRAFLEEIAARDRRERDRIVRQIVVKLDEDLLLSVDQAEAIEEALRAGWTPSMASVVMFDSMANGRRIYPGLPRPVVRRLLTDAQRKRFGDEGGNDHNDMVERQWGRMMVMRQQQQVEPDPWWDE